MFNVTDQNSDRKYKTVAYLLLLAFTFLFPLAITTAGTEITFYGSAGILITFIGHPTNCNLILFTIDISSIAVWHMVPDRSFFCVRPSL